MASTAKELLNQGKPWRSDVKWQVVAIEAVLLVAIGIYMLINTSSAGNWLLEVIGLVFLGVSLQAAVLSFRQDERSLGTIDAFRAGVGVTLGLIATTTWWSDYISTDAVRLLLGWGFIAFSALQIAGLVSARGRSGLRPATLALSALTLVLGILLLTTDDATAANRISFLGTVLLVFGVLLAGLAYLIRNRDTQAA